MLDNVRLYYPEKYIRELRMIRIALYGNNEEELEQNRKEFVHNFANNEIDKEIEIACFHEEEKLKEKWKEYQIILMEKEGLRQFKKCVSERKKRRKVTFSAGKELGTFYLDDIYYVEAELSKIHLVTKSDEYVLPLSISETEKLLEGDGFIKTHRSYLINAKHIKEIKHLLVILDNGKELPISKYRIKQVRTEYLELLG